MTTSSNTMTPTMNATPPTTDEFSARLMAECRAECRGTSTNPFRLYLARKAGFQTVEGHTQGKRALRRAEDAERAARRRATQAERIASIGPIRSEVITVDGTAFVRTPDGRVSLLGTVRAIVEKHLIGLLDSDPDGTMTLSATSSGRYIVSCGDAAIVVNHMWEAVQLLDWCSAPSSAHELIRTYNPTT